MTRDGNDDDDVSALKEQFMHKLTFVENSTTFFMDFFLLLNSKQDMLRALETGDVRSTTKKHHRSQRLFFLFQHLSNIFLCVQQKKETQIDFEQLLSTFGELCL